MVLLLVGRLPNVAGARGGSPDFHRAKNVSIAALGCLPDVAARRLLVRMRRVVSDVAVKDVERSRRCVPLICRQRHRAADGHAGGFGGSALILS